LLRFSVADIIDSLLDDAVVDLSSGGGGEGCIKITSSSSLFSFGGTVGLTHGRDMYKQMTLVVLEYDYQLLGVLSLGML